MTDRQLVIIVPSICVAVLAIGIALIRCWRRQSYRGWPAPLRWLYFAVLAYYVVTGAIGVVGLASEGNGLGLGVVGAAASALLKALARDDDPSA